MDKQEYGIQMYSVRDTAEKSLKKALEEVAKMGYKYVEFAGFFENPSEEVKAWLLEYGLKCVSTHTSIQSVAPEAIEETIAYHKALGCETIIVPWAEWDTPERIENTMNILLSAQKKLEENGMKLGYHNHSMEFLPTNDGIIFEDELINKTNIELEIDTFWLFNVGIDVVDYLEAHKDRIKMIHLKDGKITDEENRVFYHAHDGVESCSLGMGEAPIEKIRKWAIDNDVLMIVESEGLQPTGIEEAKRCIDFLRTLD